jgi:hypothetical protein
MAAVGLWDRAPAGALGTSAARESFPQWMHLTISSSQESHVGPPAATKRARSVQHSH